MTTIMKSMPRVRRTITTTIMHMATSTPTTMNTITKNTPRGMTTTMSMRNTLMQKLMIMTMATTMPMARMIRTLGSRPTTRRSGWM
jgi:hypothetical protein